MKILSKFITPGTLLACLALVMPLSASPVLNSHNIPEAFKASMSPADIIRERALALRAKDPAGSVTFKVRVDLVVDGKQQVASLSGLAMNPSGPDQPGQTTAAEIEVPFYLTEYLSDEGLDTDRLHRDVATMLSRLQAKAPTAGTESTEEAAPNCGGFAQGTEVSDQVQSCSTGTLKTAFVCRMTESRGLLWDVSQLRWSVLENGCTATQVWQQQVNAGGAAPAG